MNLTTLLGLHLLARAAWLLCMGLRLGLGLLLRLAELLCLLLLPALSAAVFLSILENRFLSKGHLLAGSVSL